MDRDEFIDFLSEELSEDPDNNRLNRILEAADEYVERAKGDFAEVVLRTRREKDNKIGRGNARWLINSDGYYPYCSACMAEPKDGIMTDFCPSCGARMEGKIT